MFDDIDKDERNFNVLYKWSSNKEFIEWENELMKSRLFVRHEDYDDHVLYKFRLTDDMMKTRELFLTGQYSKYPKTHKEAVRDFLKKRGFQNSERIFGILNLDESIRIQMEKTSNKKIQAGSELSDPPELNSENFRNSVKNINLTTNASEKCF